MKNKKAFILYEYDQMKDDYTFIAEYYNIKELQQKNNINIHAKTIYKYITTNIDDIKSKIQNKYIIIKEDIESEVF